MNPQDQENRIPRRRILQWFAAVAAAEGVSLPNALAQEAKPATKGYGQDPVLAKSYQRGEVWPLTFTAAERKAAVALADVVFPADELGPAASEVRVADFLDEWVSAPYPSQQQDRKTIIPGLKLLDEQSQTSFQKIFADLKEEEKKTICDGMAKGSPFFQLFTSLAAGAYYSVPRCWNAIGYVGNSPSGGPFAGPPQQVLDQLVLEQTVK